MTVSRFQYHAPETLEEAVKLLADKGEGAHLLAGGTDLLMKIRHGLLKPKTVIGLKRIKGLDTITFGPKTGLTIGATALLGQVAAHRDIQRRYPAIAHAARETANIQIRNMGTVVGNLCNAAPSADNAPVLMAMGAEAVLLSVGGERRLPLTEFFKGPGLTAMLPSEILIRINVPPPPPRSCSSYQHISARGKVDISAVGVGVFILLKGGQCQDIRIVMGAVAPIPMRALKAERMIRGKTLNRALLKEVGLHASKEAKPISDMRATADYRRKMVAVLTRRAVREAAERAHKQ
jgi:carbon-monoxide dehydrogenase medium subunit